MVFGRISVLLCVAASVLAAQSGFYLHDGDRVVFYGDSITDQRLYTTDTETFAVTRFPNARVTFVHSGWGGDRVTGGGGGPIDLRLDRDVFAYRPTVMTVMLGMNDASYRPYDEKIFQTYASGYEHLVDSVKTKLPNIRITLIQPSPFDDVTQPPQFEGGYNGVLLRYADFVKALAAKDGLTVADLNRPVAADLARALAIDPAGAKKLIPDRVHPGPAGHLLMAEELLKAWNAPALVTDVAIDLLARRASKSANAQVTNIQSSGWTETDRVLPMPINWKDAAVRLAMQSSDFVDALDGENLKVIGLAAGHWALKIDGQEIGSFTGEELAAGINLAKYDTPMMQQAMKVDAYTHKHADLHNTRWRNVQVPLADDRLPEMDRLLGLMDRAEAEIVEAQRKAAQPVAHTFELVSKS